MEIYKSKQIKRIFDKIQEISEKHLLQEICGLLGKKDDYYIIQQCKNISEDPANNFVLDPLQFLLFKNKYEPVALFHSHVVGNEDPSEFDIIMSENTCIPFLIYALNTKRIHVHIPKNLDVNEETINRVKTKTKERNNKSYEQN